MPWKECHVGRASPVTNFYDNLQRLNIEPQPIAGGHGNRIATLADLRAVAGTAGTNRAG